MSEFQCDNPIVSLNQSSLQLCQYGCGKVAIKFFPTKNIWCCAKQHIKCSKYEEYAENKKQLLIDKNDGKKCSYACGKYAIHYFENTQTWCCSKFRPRCSNYNQYSIKEKQKLIDIAGGLLCQYGCGQPAIHFIKNTEKWCCNKQERFCQNYNQYLIDKSKFIADVLSGIIFKHCEYGCGNKAIHYFTGSKTFCCSKKQFLCTEVIKQRITNRNKTMNQVGEDGLTVFHRTSIKIAQQRGSIGYSTGAAKMKVTKRNDIDENGLDIYQRTALKTAETRLNDIDENGLDSYERGGKKARTTGIENGVYKNAQQMTDFALYVSEVIKYTERAWRTHKKDIDPNNLKAQRSGKYHLDHIFSKAEGFRRNIPAYIIGHWTNLQILEKRTNICKSDDCWKTEQQLLEDYNQNI